MPSNRHPGPRRTLFECMHVCMSEIMQSMVVRVPFGNCETRKSGTYYAEYGFTCAIWKL